VQVQHLPSVYSQTEPVANVTTLFQYVYMKTACCLAVQDSHLSWSENITTKVNRTTVVTFVLYGWKLGLSHMAGRTETEGFREQGA